MEQIIKANGAILGMLGKAKQSASGYRLIKYCVPLQIEEGTLLFNVLTREMVLLTAEEYADILASEYLRKQWFVIPEELDEKKLVEMVRWVSGNIRKEPEYITDYTILTTTDCNARCFYCYELGRARIPMSEETARKTADFIKSHCDGKKVRISWFGGEPLYNYSVIDLICQSLQAEGVDYQSTMVSNGYLFDDAMIAKAVESWRLKRVQITLDGTEKVYNRSKAFVYREGSAYQVVTGNIARLLDAGISVFVRMNMDFHNVDDLAVLADELAQRFVGKKGLKVYAHLIFDEKTPWNERYSLEEWTRLFDAKRQLEDRLMEHGLASTGSRGLPRELPYCHCMADNGRAVVIVPDGHLGRCEHFSESEFIGHIDSEERDKAVIADWRERCDALPECGDCFHYPECYELKKCPDRMACIEPKRDAIRRRTERAMAVEFHRWQEHDVPETDEDEDTR